MMATYNGAKYLREQLDSIFSQRHIEVEVMISDDVSTDETIEICREYINRNYPLKYAVNRTNIGSNQNFMRMLYGVDANAYDLYAFSDQDDVWLPEKLGKAWAEINSKELQLNREGTQHKSHPILYCSDLINVDESLQNRRRELRGLNLHTFLRATPVVRNYYSGCTMVMNGSMVRLLQQAPQTCFATYHDAWCHQVAFYCGHVIYDLESANILRRISGLNQLGEQLPGMDFKRASLRNFFLKTPAHECQLAATRLLSGYSNFMDSEDREMLRSLAEYRNTALGKIEWALSSKYGSTSIMDTLLIRTKFLLGRL